MLARAFGAAVGSGRKKKKCFPCFLPLAPPVAVTKDPLSLYLTI